MFIRKSSIILFLLSFLAATASAGPKNKPEEDQAAKTLNEIESLSDYDGPSQTMKEIRAMFQDDDHPSIREAAQANPDSETPADNTDFRKELREAFEDRYVPSFAKELEAEQKAKAAATTRISAEEALAKLKALSQEVGVSVTTGADQTQSPATNTVAKPNFVVATPAVATPEAVAPALPPLKMHPKDPSAGKLPSSAKSKFQKKATGGIEFNEIVSDISASHFSITARNASVTILIVDTGPKAVTIKGTLPAEATQSGDVWWIGVPSYDGQKLVFMMPPGVAGTEFTVEIHNSLLKDLRVEATAGDILIKGMGEKSVISEKRMIRAISNTSGKISVANLEATKGIKLSNFNPLPAGAKVGMGISLLNVAGLIRTEIGELSLSGSNLAGELVHYSNGGNTILKNSKFTTAIVKAKRSPANPKAFRVSAENIEGPLSIESSDEVVVKQSSGKKGAVNILAESNVTAQKNLVPVNIRTAGNGNIILEDQEAIASVKAVGNGNVTVSNFKGQELFLSADKGAIEAGGAAYQPVPQRFTGTKSLACIVELTSTEPAIVLMTTVVF